MAICFECGSLKQGATCPVCDGAAAPPPAAAAATAAAPITRPMPAPTPGGAPPPRPPKTAAQSLPSLPTSNLARPPAAALSPYGQPPARPATASKPQPPPPRAGAAPAAATAAAPIPTRAPAYDSKPLPSPTSAVPAYGAKPLPPPSTSSASAPPARFTPRPELDDWEQLVASPPLTPGGSAGSAPPPPVNRRTKPAYDWQAISSNPQLQQEHYASLKVDTDTSADAVARAREMLNMGNATLRQLSSQANAIDGVENNVEAIHMQLDRGDRHLRSIEGVTGTISNLVSTDKQDKNLFFARTQGVDHTLPEYQAGGGIAGLTDPADPAARLSYAPSPHDTTPTALKLQLEQQDRDLEELEQLMMGLQGVAVTMNSELTRQNQQLDYMNLRTASATQKTHDTNYRINRLM